MNKAIIKEGELVPDGSEGRETAGHGLKDDQDESNGLESRETAPHGPTDESDGSKNRDTAPHESEDKSVAPEEETSEIEGLLRSTKC